MSDVDIAAVVKKCGGVEMPNELRTDDRIALADLMARFAHGLDRRDWDLYRSVFTDEIDLDYSSWRAGSRGPWSADDWVARASGLFPGLTASRHALSNLLISFDGPDEARVQANVCADHVLDDGESAEVFTVNGHYDDRCVLTPDGWRVRAKRLNVEWTAGDRTILDRARDRAAAQPQSGRG